MFQWNAVSLSFDERAVMKWMKFVYNFSFKKRVAVTNQNWIHFTILGPTPPIRHVVDVERWSMWEGKNDLHITSSFYEHCAKRVKLRIDHFDPLISASLFSLWSCNKRNIASNAMFCYRGTNRNYIAFTWPPFRRHCFARRNTTFRRIVPPWPRPSNQPYTFSLSNKL
jgi:hypothetical protein